MKLCKTCGRAKHEGLCDLVELSDGTLVHAIRIDAYDGDVRKRIEQGEVRVVNRWRKFNQPKRKVRRS